MYILNANEALIIATYFFGKWKAFKFVILRLNLKSTAFTIE